MLVLTLTTCFLVLLVIAAAADQFPDSERTDTASGNHENFTILSFRRNHIGHDRSPWVDQLFGPNAISFRGKEYLSGSQNGSGSAPLFREKLQSLGYGDKCDCSIELLGVVKLDVASPFMHGNRDYSVMGNASMVLSKSSVEWSCFYRVQYEHWRMSQYFWQVFFFCPTPHSSACHKHPKNVRQQKLKGHMILSTHDKIWRSDFSIDSPSSKIDRQPDTPFPQKAVCLAIPYVSSQPIKAEPNGAMIYEWVRHYSLLGFKVFVYDKNGLNRNAIFSSPYSLSQNQQGRQWMSNIVYHPNTVFSELEHSDRRFDNTIPVSDVGMRVVYYLDDDKTATLTRCRFEASAIHGYETVLVADFDEFIFCPNAASTYAGQAHFIDAVTEKYKDRQIDQLVFLQLWTATNRAEGKYKAPIDCLLDKMAKQLSIFECFGGFARNQGTRPYGKSIHLRHKCPLTDFHKACLNADCACSCLHSSPYPQAALIPESDQCYFIHLSTDPRDYTNNATLPLAEEAIPSELLQMIIKNASVVYSNWHKVAEK